jgi:hypothetical protein
LLPGALEFVGVVDDVTEGGAGGESDCCLDGAVPSADDISTSIVWALGSVRGSKFEVRSLDLFRMFLGGFLRVRTA